MDREGTFFVVSRQGEDYVVAYVEDADLDGGTVGLVAEGVLALDGGDLAGPLDVVWPEPPDGSAPDLVIANLVIGPRVGTGKDFWNDQGAAFHARYTDYALTGTLTRPDDGVVRLDCQFQEATSWERYTVSAGQKPGGRPPVNDAPRGAIELAPSTTLRTTTRGAAVPPEATCELVFETPDGPVGEAVPLGRTVWYSLTGTGEEVLLTTAGSDFDTVVGVYDQSLNQITCVDDADTPLAELSLLTEPGVQYLVQVGGYASHFGRLVLSVD